MSRLSTAGGPRAGELGEPATETANGWNDPDGLQMKQKHGTQKVCTPGCSTPVRTRRAPGHQPISWSTPPPPRLPKSGGDSTRPLSWFSEAPSRFWKIDSSQATLPDQFPQSPCYVETIPERHTCSSAARDRLKVITSAAGLDGDPLCCAPLLRTNYGAGRVPFALTALGRGRRALATVLHRDGHPMFALSGRPEPYLAVPICPAPVDGGGDAQVQVERPAAKRWDRLLLAVGWAGSCASVRT